MELMSLSLSVWTLNASKIRISLVWFPLDFDISYFPYSSSPTPFFSMSKFFVKYLVLKLLVQGPMRINRYFLIIQKAKLLGILEISVNVTLIL